MPSPADASKRAGPDDTHRTDEGGGESVPIPFLPPFQTEPSPPPSIFRLVSSIFHLVSPFPMTPFGTPPPPPPSRNADQQHRQRGAAHGPERTARARDGGREGQGEEGTARVEEGDGREVAWGERGRKRGCCRSGLTAGRPRLSLLAQRHGDGTSASAGRARGPGGALRVTPMESVRRSAPPTTAEATHRTSLMTPDGFVSFPAPPDRLFFRCRD